MKKLALILLSLSFLTGCTNINNLNLEEVVNNNLSSKQKLSNQYRSGYKYYLPRGLSVVNQSDYNEKLNNDRYTYYLYVDVISYFNKVEGDYEPKDDVYYSKTLNSNGLKGYIEIKETVEKDNKYLVEIMYNYAKIEVIVKQRDLNSTIANSLTILNSIQYNDNIIDNMMKDNKLQYKETEMNIFKTKETTSNYINYEEMYGQYDDSNDIHDSDLIE